MIQMDTAATNANLINIIVRLNGMITFGMSSSEPFVGKRAKIAKVSNTKLKKMYAMFIFHKTYMKMSILIKCNIL